MSGRMSEKTRAARECGWMVYVEGVAYGRRLSATSELFILREGRGQFTVWRGSWTPGERQPFSERTVVQKAPFERALDAANKYADRFTSEAQDKPRRSYASGIERMHRRRERRWMPQ